MKRVRRIVTVSDLTAERCSGGRTMLWAFSVADLAQLLGVTEDCIRQRIRRGLIDPSTLCGLLDATRGQV
ncbi:MAG TPA: hypothetical protein VM537_07830 [Anaerolineae bacterium]|nr:hypothetical protein [Anaerolineae bacterium]